MLLHYKYTREGERPTQQISYSKKISLSHSLVSLSNIFTLKYFQTRASFLRVSHQQVRRAKIWALTEFEKTLEEHYALLRPYGEALLRSNPGSTVQLGVTTNPDGKSYFERFYVCLNGLKQGFKSGCRKVVALDGCFLKGSCNGELLSAVGRDGNNQVYPIAWAIVNVENKENWTWFINLLGNDLECPDGDGLTLMSDQHKGLIEAVKDIMPRAEHRQCARHIYENFRKQYSGVEFRLLFWKASKASYPAQFEAAMNEIRLANPNAYKYLIERNPKSWSRAFFWVHTGCEAVENGFSECWNSVLLKVRNKPIITLLEALRVIVMIRLENIREKSAEWEHDVCPAIRKKLDVIKNSRHEWLVIHAGGSKFEVRNYSTAYSVDVDAHSCSCRMWDLSGIPCVHGVNAIYKLNQEPEDFISAWFRQSMYREAYDKYLNPVEGMETWPACENNTKPLPPKPRKMPGRPKKKRIRASHEPRVGSTRVTKHGTVITCHNCWEEGHNTRTCQNQQKPRPAHIPKANIVKRKPKVPANQSNPTASHQNPPASKQNPTASQSNPPASQQNPTASHQNPPASQQRHPEAQESVPADQGSALSTQESAPLSTGRLRRFGVTKGGFKFGITCMGNEKVGLGNTMNWLSSRVGSSGMIIREQPRITTMDETISMSAPRRNNDPVVGTQESVNGG